MAYHAEYVGLFELIVQFVKRGSVNRTKKRPTRRLLFVIAGAAVLVIGTVSAIALSAPGPIRHDEVGDHDSAAAYLEQKVPGYLHGTESSGTIEVRTTTVRDARNFIRSAFGVQELAWDNTGGALEARVAVYRSEPGSFQVPRPRPGFDSGLDGDTLILITADGGQLQGLAIVSWDDVSAELSAFPVVFTEDTTIVRDAPGG